MLRIGVMSDCHLGHDAAVFNRGRAQAADGLNDGLPIRWWRHILERARMPGHPRLGPDIASIRGVDLVLIAGDTWAGAKAVDYADKVAAYCGCPVVMIAGNHEFYGADITATLAIMAAAATRTNDRVRFLDDGHTDIVIGECRVAVLGSLFWTDYRLNGIERQVESMIAAKSGLSDHLYITMGGRPFTPADALALHERSRAWLAEAVRIAKIEADIVIVMVHHGVVPDANAEAYRGGILSPAFASDISEEISAWGADLVVSGHTHHPLDIIVGNTRVVSAPRGYIGTEPGVETYVPMIVEF